ncbi:alpha-D-ribose 1-methylphosphonate 5-triphosphate diphosphatase [Aurantimonas sp. Leaf443]|uniref:alpha-D-ribose 1-methylphosphonate 5-triphosphate diphosphatase n=1 Tax=Aurantimonas sp. Leaf443 TaxID=1736378 RepID=UPI0006FF35DB|nr:alpha-D-ribose 1-methylphosphonate 5-triphosphate diphosphatase [Aurantimonas sp. Leaf443]KQT82176.1 phosphonate metabolism protein PhnM [Aurantimonas sp. Leaf443]
MADETILANARLVLPGETVHGHIVLRDGLIAAVDTGAAPAGAEDMGGDTIVAGLVELHTDHIEGHYIPRRNVFWNLLAAIQAHDAQIATSGITTVFDALRVGTDDDAAMNADHMSAMAAAIDRSAREGRLRADHFIHLRCEVSADDGLEGFRAMEDSPRLKLVSLMDHAPGQRQYADLAQYRGYYQKKLALTDEAFETFSARRIAQSLRNAGRTRAAVCEACHARGIAIASHDDATLAHVAESAELGAALAEFPTTLEAARASREAGLKVLMGGPNIVRGGSHSGNVSALELWRAGLLDILSSDYVPFSLLQSAFLLAETGEASLSEAMALVSTNPARAVGLDDRGAVETGLRADLVRVATSGEGEPPVVRAVYREGRRVA